MLHLLISIIIIIMGFVCTIIANPITCASLPDRQKVITGGRISTMESKVDEKRADVLKIVMPQKVGPNVTFEDVISDETEAIHAKPAFSMTLNPCFPRLPYRRRPFELKGVIHWGQLKLMLSEIQFLSEHGHFSNTIVYAGAAPGTHIKFLSKMFPKHKFILWDPRAFNVTGPMIETHEEYFTDEVAKTYANQDILFISDIRTGDSKDEKCDFEGRVRIDMEWQMNWHKIIRPAMAMYKFRLPYASGKTKYMDGTLQMQVFAPTSTTELRLIVPQDMRTKIYDNDEVEEQMYYFNYFTRPKWFGQPLRCCHLDGCWDCTAMMEIIKKYLSNVKHISNPSYKILSAYVKEILATCSTVNRLNTPPHGDGSNVGWFKRMHKYSRVKMPAAKRGLGLGHADEKAYRALVNETKKKNPKLIFSPIITLEH
jgi:hypothetical protein